MVRTLTKQKFIGQSTPSCFLHDEVPNARRSHSILSFSSAMYGFNRNKLFLGLAQRICPVCGCVYLIIMLTLF
jgi:hypothetical protein